MSTISITFVNHDTSLECADVFEQVLSEQQRWIDSSIAYIIKGYREEGYVSKYLYSGFDGAVAPLIIFQDFSLAEVKIIHV